MSFDVQAALSKGANKQGIAQYLSDAHGESYESLALKKYTDEQIIDLFKDKERPNLLRAPKGDPPAPNWIRDYPNLGGLFGGTRAIYDKLGKPALEALGSIKGSALGTAVGGPVSGTMLGGVAGFMGARTLNDTITEGLDKMEGYNPLYPVSGMDRAERVKDNVKEGLQYEMGGAALGPGLQALGRGGKAAASASKNWTQKKLNLEPTPEARAIKARMAQKGMKPAPGVYYGNETLGIVEYGMSIAPFSSNVVSKHRLANIQALEKDTEKFLKSYYDDLGVKMPTRDMTDKLRENVSDYILKGKGDLNKMRQQYLSASGVTGTPRQVGDDFVKSADAEYTKKMGEAEKLYNAFFKKAKGPLTNKGQQTSANFLEPVSLRKEAKKQFNEIISTPGHIEGARKNHLQNLTSAIGLKAKKNEIENLVKRVNNSGLNDNEKADVINNLTNAYSKKKSLGDIESFRKNMNRLMSGEVRDSGKLTPLGRDYRLLKEAIDNDYTSIAKQGGQKTVDAIKTARKYYEKNIGEVHLTRNVGSLVKLAKEKPSNFVDEMWSANVDAKQVGIVMRAVDKTTRKKIENSFFSKIMREENDAVWKPETVSAQLSQFKRTELNQIFDEKIINDLYKVGKDGVDLYTKKYSQPFLQKMAEAEPDMLLDLILGAKTKAFGDPMKLKGNLITLRKTLSHDRDTELQFGGRLLEKVLVKNQHDLVPPNKLGETLHQLKEEGIFDFLPSKSKDHLSKLGDELKYFDRYSDRVAASLPGQPKGGMTRGVMTSSLVTGTAKIIGFMGGMLTAGNITKLYYGQNIPVLTSALRRLRKVGQWASGSRIVNDPKLRYRMTKLAAITGKNLTTDDQEPTHMRIGEGDFEVSDPKNAPMPKEFIFDVKTRKIMPVQ